MDKGDVIQFLSSLPVGTIIAWASVIIIIITATSYVLAKLYKLFDKYRKIKLEDDEIKQTILDHEKEIHEIEIKLDDDLKMMVQAHESKLQNIAEQLATIQNMLNEQKQVALKNLRHSIIRAGEEALSNGSITIRKLRCLEELYDEYSKDFNGNGYVTTLMTKVRKLEVIGNLDENDEDIDT